MNVDVVHHVESDEFGGLERAALAIVSGLHARGADVVLAHPPGATRLHTLAAAAGIETAAVPRIESKGDVAALRTVVRFLRSRQPGVLHAHLAWPGRCIYALIAARIARVPRIVVHQQLFPNELTRRERLRHALVSLLADRVVTVSAHMARQVAAAAPWAARKTRVVRNAVAVSQPPRPAPALRERDAREPVALTLARLDSHQKGLEYLIAASVRLPGVRVLVAGDGPARGELQALVRAHGVGDRVHLLGYRSDVPALLAACDVFVLPSLFEGLPLSVLEAMAAARPVVATNIPGTDEAVVHDVTGLLVPPRDADALAAAVRRLLAEPDLAVRLAAEGRRRVETVFSADRMVAEVENVYAELATPSRRWRPSPPKRDAIAS
jgi:glycosyltransferase involved in cell wall biosynthesis